MQKTAKLKRMVCFKARVRKWTAFVRASQDQIRVKHMRRKWASCSMRRKCSFASGLLDEPSAFQDYVIVYELLHLKIGTTVLPPPVSRDLGGPLLERARESENPRLLAELVTGLVADAARGRRADRSTQPGRKG